MTVTHQCVRPGAGGHSVYTPVHCMGGPLGGVGMQVCVVFTIIVGFMLVLYKCVHVVTDRADF